MNLEALKPHRKLIISQIAAVMAAGAFLMAYLRYRQTGEWQEQMFGSFMLFGLLLVAVEVKCLLDWLKARKTGALQRP